MKLVRFVHVAALLVCGIGQAAHAAELLKLVTTIPLKGVAGKLDHLAVDSKGERLFVANKPNNTLDIVDLKTNKLIKQIPDQKKVSGVTYAADLDMIYVGNGAGVCNAIDGKTYEQVFSTPANAADNVHFHSGNQEDLCRTGRDPVRTGRENWSGDRVDQSSGCRPRFQNR